MSPNSLQGSVLAQGMMFVQRMREAFPGVCVTETHPKALLVALGTDEEGFYTCFSVDLDAGAVSEHERDAVISAVAARMSFEGHEDRWTHDLGRSRYSSEQDPAESWLGPVHYFWPHKK